MFLKEKFPIKTTIFTKVVESKRRYNSSLAKTEEEKNETAKFHIHMKTGEWVGNYHHSPTLCT